MSVRFEALTGERLAQALPSLAELRIAVFRDFPYLYDGTLAYEQDYLARFAAAASLWSGCVSRCFSHSPVSILARVL